MTTQNSGDKGPGNSEIGNGGGVVKMEKLSSGLGEGAKFTTVRAHFSKWRSPFYRSSVFTLQGRACSIYNILVMPMKPSPQSRGFPR